MQRNIKHILYTLIAFIVVLASAILLFNKSEIGSKAVIENIYTSENVELLASSQDEHIKSIVKLLPETSSVETYMYNNLPEIYQNTTSGIFVYSHNKLLHWSTNQIPVPQNDSTLLTSQVLVQLPNGWYLQKSIQKNEYNIIFLLLISHDYSYKNDLLLNGFNPAFELPEEAKFSKESNEFTTAVNYQNETLFYINYSDVSPYSTLLTILSFVTSLLALILLFSLFASTFAWLKNSFKNSNILFLALIADLFLLRWLMLHFGFPELFYHFELFSPKLFAQSYWLPSLGDYLLNSFCFLLFASLFHKHFKTQAGQVKKWASVIISISLSALIGYSYTFLSSLFTSLVMNSSIPFDFSSIISITMYSVIGLVIVISIIASILLITDRLFQQLQSLISFKIFAPILLVVSTLIYYLISPSNNIIPLPLYTLLFIILSWVRLRNKQYSIYSYLLLLIIIASLSSEKFTTLSANKEIETRKVLAANLANERDPSAEFFITILNDDISNNNEIKTLVQEKSIDSLYQNIFNQHFKTYLNKYDLQVSICEGEDSLLIKPDNRYTPCLSFFSNILVSSGIPIPGTHFYFLDNQNGRISYFGYFQYQVSDSIQRNLFLELNSKIFSEGLGYPELLIDKKYAPKSTLKKYSYAKYNNQHLIASRGSFEYPVLKSNPNNSDKEYYLEQGKYFSHLYYAPTAGSLIIISVKHQVSSARLVSFSYIFFILFISFNIIWLILNLQKEGGFKPSSMKNKIQVSFMSILLLSLVLTGSISIYFILDGYKQRQFQNLQDKVRSVQVEVEHKISNEPQLTDDIQEYMNYLLVKFSNVFFTDINLYDLNGELFASSRMELYNKGLQGTFIRPQAYHELKINNSGIVIQEESIGNLNYFSAYVPFRNNKNEVIAYLNLPYFARQDEFKDEISEFIMAFTNVFLVLLLISILFGIIISNQLTRPLALIQEKIKAIDIGKKGEKINYRRKDELGGLIKEYNKKIDELANSAQKLAQSERESAWREMAKQIAHEIKNPLTPMKLSVQFLERTYKPNDKDWHKTLKSVSQTIIEQIDTLSAIATEFSNFAQMPLPRTETVDLIDKINNSVQLFGQEENISFNVKHKDLTQAIIIADKEQMLRVFNNLIKNSIQAIPFERKGEIEIEISEEARHFLVRVTDNGSGIAEDMQTKIFHPNFTTKTSGMGLGLSMVRNIIVNMGGEIWFETNLNEGSSFYIRVLKPDNNS